MGATGAATIAFNVTSTKHLLVWAVKQEIHNDGDVVILFVHCDEICDASLPAWYEPYPQPPPFYHYLWDLQKQETH